ncbi:MAG: VWA domain-containing protein [Armatimonadetes bacterium]|nr:VWA domain-containing protein [Armatimonadota bacterium]
MTFANPAYLLLLLLVPVAVWLHVARARRAEARLVYSDVRALGGGRPSLRVRALSLLPPARLAAVTLLVIALARPQKLGPQQQHEGEGIDIVLVMDVSYSMRAEDFGDVNRFTGAEQVLSRFARGIVNDRLALVIFATQAFTQCPLTLDHEMVGALIDQVELGLISGDSTAIGMALTTAASRLERSAAKSKVIILLTDGENNAGSIAPPDAARACQALGIRVYTIGIGSKEGSPVPVELPTGERVYARNRDGTLALTKLDEDLLTEIAKTTGGEYHHAGDPNALQAVYESIWKLEKSRFEVKTFRKRTELCGRFLWPAICLLALELLASATILRKAP